MCSPVPESQKENGDPHLTFYQMITKYAESQKENGDLRLYVPLPTVRRNLKRRTAMYIDFPWFLVGYMNLKRRTAIRSSEI